MARLLFSSSPNSSAADASAARRTMRRKPSSAVSCLSPRFAQRLTAAVLPVAFPLSSSLSGERVRGITRLSFRPSLEDEFLPRRIRVVFSSVARSATDEQKKPATHWELRALKKWRPHGDSNPGSHRERVVSWTGLDDGDAKNERGANLGSQVGPASVFFRFLHVTCPQRIFAGSRTWLWRAPPHVA